MYVRTRAAFAFAKLSDQVPVPAKALASMEITSSCAGWNGVSERAISKDLVASEKPVGVPVMAMTILLPVVAVVVNSCVAKWSQSTPGVLPVQLPISQTYFEPPRKSVSEVVVSFPTELPGEMVPSTATVPLMVPVPASVPAVATVMGEAPWVLLIARVPAEMVVAPV